MKTPVSCSHGQICLLYMDIHKTSPRYTKHLPGDGFPQKDLIFLLQFKQTNEKASTYKPVSSSVKQWLVLTILLFIKLGTKLGTQCSIGNMMWAGPFSLGSGACMSLNPGSVYLISRTNLGRFTVLCLSYIICKTVIMIVASP